MPPKSISEMTAGSCVFLTGVTGFVGGCLLERLCKLEPGPDRIFLLIRRKKGEDPETRLRKIFSLPLFAGVPALKFERVRLIVGDVGSEAVNLGLSASDVDLLMESCTHIFHVAAFISFAAQLDLAIRVNLLGSRAVLGLARRMKKLKAMVHVSTAYVNCTLASENSEFLETIYPLDIDPLEFVNAVKSMSPKDLENKYRESIAKYPNTYAFTKRLSESLLTQERENVPLSIVRPGIILNSWREPFTGWVDNVNSGACGFIAGAGKGIFRTLQARGDKLMDVIPVDMVVSTILLAALKTELEPNKVHIFHCTSGTVNPTSWGEYCNDVVRYARVHPCTNSAWYPEVTIRENSLRNDLVILIFQMIPSFFIDLFANYTKPGHILMDLQRKFIKGNKYTSFFSLREWHFSRKETDKLIQLLLDDEIDKHPMDPKFINWHSYFENCVIGTRLYFHKDPEKMSARARREMAVFRIIASLAPAISFTVVYICLVFAFALPWTVALPISLFLVLTLVWL